MFNSTLSFIFILAACIAFGQEICNNQIDDDHDGLVDSQDKDDCPCIYQQSSSPSLIPNPSFEQLSCTPQGYSQLSCAAGWNQATSATSDLISPSGFMPAHLPDAPDGSNYAGTIIFDDYLEYLGACLTATMKAGASYTLIFDLAATSVNVQPACEDPIPFEVTLFGNPDCVAFPLVTENCPAGFGFAALGSTTYTPSTEWQKVRITFIAPQDINSIILGSSCTVPAGFGCYDYFLWDNLQLTAGEEEALYYVPNCFTPDGNEHNQRFEPVFTCGFDPLHYELKVFDRWGQNVFASSDPQTGWDGTLNGVLMQDGIYAWTIRYKSPTTDETEVISGHVGLLR